MCMSMISLFRRVLIKSAENNSIVIFSENPFLTTNFEGLNDRRYRRWEVESQERPKMLPEIPLLYLKHGVLSQTPAEVNKSKQEL